VRLYVHMYVHEKSSLFGLVDDDHCRFHAVSQTRSRFVLQNLQRLDFWLLFDHGLKCCVDNLTMDKSFHAKLSEKRILNLKCSNVYVANFYDPAYRFLTTLL
jgi:hypothetical protein